jgi:hypothetical protein
VFDSTPEEPGRQSMEGLAASTPGSPQFDDMTRLVLGQQVLSTPRLERHQPVRKAA